MERCPDKNNNHLSILEFEPLSVPIRMKKTKYGSLFAILITSLFLPLSDGSAVEETTSAEEVFVHRVFPLFKEKCFSCHGEDRDDVRGQFNMLTRVGILRGGESEEPSVVPGKPEESSLYLAVLWDDLEMPPKENDRLSTEQIEYVKRWIAGGAPWPSAQQMKEIRRKTSNKWKVDNGVSVRTSGGLSAEWTNRLYDPKNLWAYQPLWRDEGRVLRSVDENPIDTLIEQRLDELQLVGAPRADRRLLIRRATFDLTGLPPSPAEVEAFVSDADSDQRSFETVLERLLASPHYGEQWGRHWLDVVRYADSSGFANDYERGSAWRYRDYVVRAFNSDKPYDQFVREQIAGDELAAADPEMLIAVGFLRMGPWELTGMEVAKIARQRFLDDVTDAVGQVFLGHMLQCARCHDHKFDPIPTRDYYSMQAVFATTQLTERAAPFLDVENTAGFDEKKYLQQRNQFYNRALQEVNSKRTVEAARKWYADNDKDATSFEEVVAELKTKRPNAKVNVSNVRNIMAKRKVDPALIPPRHVGFEPVDFGMERVARKGVERLKWRLDRYEPIACSVYSGLTPMINSVKAPQRLPANPLKNGELEKTAILGGGDPFSPKEPVPPAILSVVESALEATQSAVELTSEIVGRRKGLADWIASEDNPLTARVMANRIWQWHFGQALAGNPNNFGTTGEKPTHPELLDFLAGRLIASGWSVKALHRLIMTSDAYTRSSQYSEPKLLAERDPLGISYAQFLPRRLEAEEIRDAMLAVSGELIATLGGIPIRPEMNLEAALQPRMVMGTFAEAWQPSPLPEQRHRRSLYALRIRGHRDPFFEVFNAPSPDLSCEARDASTVTPQVFAMFNSEITFDRALAFAHRVAGQVPGEGLSEAAIDQVFRLAFGRAPEDHEMRVCLQHWKTMTARHEKLHFDPPNYPKEVVRNAVEENTGEKFSFVEPLEVYADFVPDLKPSNASPELRGLAEVCLVLLNSNEFIYVY
jgi:mono/diheme cytochrome c family protein